MRVPIRRELLAAVVPLKPSGFVSFIMKNVKRKINLKLDVAGHNKGIVSLMANVTCLFLVSLEKSDSDAIETCFIFALLEFVLCARFL